VVETPDSLLFSNLGSFIPGTVEQMIRRDAPPEVYRNPFLAQAMVNLNMIDTIGSGIKKMFVLQRQRSFPMPDYVLDDPQKVAVRLTGEVLDENYTQLLMSQAELDLMDVIALDRVQKKGSAGGGGFPAPEGSQADRGATAESVRLGADCCGDGRQGSLHQESGIRQAALQGYGGEIPGDVSGSDAGRPGPIALGQGVRCAR
jgi:hypothetical protein